MLWMWPVAKRGVSSAPQQPAAKRRRSYSVADRPKSENPPPAGHNRAQWYPHWLRSRIRHPLSCPQVRKQGKEGPWMSVLSCARDSVASRARTRVGGKFPFGPPYRRWTPWQLRFLHPTSVTRVLKQSPLVSYQPRSQQTGFSAEKRQAYNRFTCLSCWWGYNNRVPVPFPTDTRTPSKQCASPLGQHVSAKTLPQLGLHSSPGRNLRL